LALTSVRLRTFVFGQTSAETSTIQGRPNPMTGIEVELAVLVPDVLVVGALAVVLSGAGATQLPFWQIKPAPQAVLW